jgi:hypothetical protein
MAFDLRDVRWKLRFFERHQRRIYFGGVTLFALWLVFSMEFKFRKPESINNKIHRSLISDRKAA